MNPVAALAEGFGPALFVSGVLFIAFLAVFARKKTGWVILGFLRVVGALFSEPVRYLHRIIHQYAGVGSEGLGSVPGTKKGLLATFLFYLQVGLAVGAIGILSLGTISAWKAFLPPSWAEARLEAGRRNLESSRKELETLRGKLTSLEGSLAQKKAEVVSQFRAQRQKTLQDSAQVMANAEKAVMPVPSGADALGKIKAFLADKSAPTTTWESSDPKEKVQMFISNSVMADAGTKAALQNYIDAWYQRMVAQVELANFDENQIARQLEVERGTLSDSVREKEAELKDEGTQVEALKEAASFRFGSALLALVTALGQFLGFIWVSGLLLELLELALRHICNVQDIRDRLDRGDGAGISGTEPATERAEP